MKKHISLLTGIVFGVITVLSAFPSTAFADETAGFTLEEIDKSEIKPELYISVEGQKYGKVYDLADVAGKTVTCSLCVSGANEKYATTDIFILYDKRLEITINEEKNTKWAYYYEYANVHPSKAIERLVYVADPIEEYTIKQFHKEGNQMNGIRVATAGSRDYGLDGEMWTIEFLIPASANKGDVFPIDIVYYEYNNGDYVSYSSLFYNVDADNVGELMSAYTFTKGIYNEKYNNNFAANENDIAQCAALANIDKSYDGYIAISDNSSSAVTTTSTASEKLLGDANLDKKVTVADAVAILQSIANKDKYALTPTGAANADCCDVGDGITAKDALAIQKLDAHEIDALPETSK